MTEYSSTEKTFLLKTARSVIASALSAEADTPEGRAEDFPALLEKRGCFVTLHKQHALRGCIGTIQPLASLYEGVKSNALNAAFRDPRFPSVTADELPEINIEISVLSQPEPLDHESPEELLEKLIPDRHGVILTHGWHSATFLPQVWEQLPDKKTFLSHLCTKAGVSRTAWRDRETQVQIYTVTYFSE